MSLSQKVSCGQGLIVKGIASFLCYVWETTEVQARRHAWIGPESLPDSFFASKEPNLVMWSSDKVAN